MRWRIRRTARRCVRAVSVNWRATRSNSPEELSTLSMMPPTPVWNSSTNMRNSALRCSVAAAAAAACSVRMRWRSCELFLNTAMVRAISPISSARSSQSISTSLLPFGNRRQRGRDRGQRLGDAAHHQHGQDQHQQRGNAGRDGHGLDRLRQHALELRHRDADKENADDLCGRIHNGIVGGHEVLAEQHRRSLIGLATAHYGLPGMIGGELGTDGAVAVLLLQIGGAAHELVGGVVIDKQRGVAADIGHRAIDDRMVLEFRHLGDFGAGDRTILHGDLGVAIALGEGHRQGAEIDLDVPQGPVVELGGQRPIGGTDHQPGVHRDQDDRADDRLGAKLELERRQELPN